MTSRFEYNLAVADATKMTLDYLCTLNSKFRYKYTHDSLARLHMFVCPELTGAVHDQKYTTHFMVKRDITGKNLSIRNAVLNGDVRTDLNNETSFYKAHSTDIDLERKKEVYAEDQIWEIITAAAKVESINFPENLLDIVGTFVTDISNKTYHRFDKII